MKNIISFPNISDIEFSVSKVLLKIGSISIIGTAL